jgi:hypothetical protein
MNGIRFLGALAITAAGLAGVAATAWAAGPTSPEMRAEMIRLIDQLEKYPNEQSAGGARTKVMDWLTEAPDVTVNVCGDLLGGLDKYNENQAGDLLMALMFSEAKFILQNPERAADDHAVHLAGVEGVLRTYAAMKGDDPNLKIKPMENLARLQAEQKLPEHVTKAMEKCN